ncbi:outer membrane protein [Bradyrhizobium erythrophlei]|uniref:Opacity protein n=1 Tax=Bradyrhizobium erythrophlei TaxID=1437360 RepID=A0A1M5M0I7_9BRAD|nr:outer membrane beta-barrel protein [Bradyrhizobium erythrophlei]SHG70864.1 Opacity protein [Bradyrhizobium erythrophlei]
MRRFVLAAMMFGAVSSAQAADMPDFLRGSLPAGPAPTRNWSGWYAGGQVGYSWTNTDYGKTVVSMTNDLFRSTTLQAPVSQLTLLGRVNGQSPAFGAFVGRNFQFDDIVLGVEANYNYLSSLATSTAASLGPIQVAEPTLVLPAGATAADGVTLKGSAALQVKDEVTFRGRAGWATGDFLPYIFGGLAVGRMDVTRTVSSSVTRTINFANGTSTSFQLPQFALTTTDGRSNNFVAGWTAGLGMEYMLWDCVFLRGEWEYIKFLSIKDSVVTQNSVHAGIGYKF